MSILTHLIDSAQGKHPLGAKRSPEWARLSKAYKRKIGVCEGCGYPHFLQVHHIIPFHIRPDLELESWNWIVLCEPPHRVRKCHLILGHLGDFKQYNPDVEKMASEFKQKIVDAHHRAYGSA